MSKVEEHSFMIKSNKSSERTMQRTETGGFQIEICMKVKMGSSNAGLNLLKPFKPKNLHALARI
jgi:hypothetical protein